MDRSCRTCFFKTFNHEHSQCGGCKLNPHYSDGFKQFMTDRYVTDSDVFWKDEETKKEEPVSKDNPLDVQVGGSHYKALEIQPVTYIHANKIPFIEGNIIKYITRWREKGGKADLEKVKHFVDLLIELEFKDETPDVR